MGGWIITVDALYVHVSVALVHAGSFTYRAILARKNTNSKKVRLFPIEEAADRRRKKVGWRKSGTRSPDEESVVNFINETHQSGLS